MASKGGFSFVENSVGLKKKSLVALKGLQAFAQSKDLFLEQLAQTMTPRFVSPGDAFCVESSEMIEMYFLRRGCAEGKADKQKAEEFNDGSVIGNPASMINRENWPYTVAATGLCDMLVLAAKDLRMALDMFPGEGKKILQKAKPRFTIMHSVSDGATYGSERTKGNDLERRLSLAAPTGRERKSMISAYQERKSLMLDEGPRNPADFDQLRTVSMPSAGPRKSVTTRKSTARASVRQSVKPELTQWQKIQERFKIQGQAASQTSSKSRKTVRASLVDVTPRHSPGDGSRQSQRRSSQKGDPRRGSAGLPKFKDLDAQEALHSWAFAVQEQDEASMREVAAWLDTIPFFANMDAFVFERLLPLFDRRTFKKGEHLLSEGSETTALHVIYAGYVHIEVGGHKLNTLGPGTIAGERAILRHGLDATSPKSGASVVAATTVVVSVAIPRSALMDMQSKDPWLIRQLEKQFDLQKQARGDRALAEMKLFSSADLSFTRTLELVIRYQKFEQRQFIFREGEKSADIYILYHGTVQLSNGKHMLSRITASNFADAVMFGIVNAFGVAEKRTCTVISSTETKMIVIQQDTLKKVLDEFPAESKHFRNLVERRPPIMEEEILLTRVRSAGNCQNAPLDDSQSPVADRSSAKYNFFQSSRDSKFEAKLSEKYHAYEMDPEPFERRTTSDRVSTPRGSREGVISFGGEQEALFEKDRLSQSSCDGDDSDSSEDSKSNVHVRTTEAWNPRGKSVELKDVDIICDEDNTQPTDTPHQVLEANSSNDCDVMHINIKSIDASGRNHHEGSDCAGEMDSELGRTTGDEDNLRHGGRCSQDLKTNREEARPVSGIIKSILKKSGKRKSDRMKPSIEKVVRCLLQSGSQSRLDKDMVVFPDMSDGVDDVKAKPYAKRAGTVRHSFADTSSKVWVDNELVRVNDFSGMSKSLLKDLEPHQTFRLYMPTQAILREGEDLGDIMILQKGRADVFLYGDQLPSIKGPCVIGGLMSLLTTKGFANVIASQACFVAAISKRSFGEVLDRWPGERRSIFQMVSKSFESLCTHYVEHQTKCSTQALSELPLLSDAPAEFISELAAVVEPHLLLPGQIAISSSTDDPKLFFLFDGYCHLLSDDVVLGSISNKMVFGEMEVFGLVDDEGGHRRAVKTVELCNVGTVRRKELFELLDQFPKERLRFERLVHTRLEESIYTRVIAQRCFEQLPSQFVSNLCVHIERCIYLADSIIVKEREPGDTFLILNCGRVDIFFNGMTVGMLWAGKSFGAAQVLGLEREYHATLHARKSCHILQLARKTLTSLTSGGRQEKEWLTEWKQRAKVCHETELSTFRRKKREHLSLLRAGSNMGVMRTFSDATDQPIKSPTKGACLEQLRIVFHAWMVLVKGLEYEEELEGAAGDRYARSKEKVVESLDYFQSGKSIRFCRAMRRVELEVNGEGVFNADVWRTWSQSGRLDLWKGTPAPTWLAAVRDEIPRQLTALKAEARGGIATICTISK